MGIPSAKGQKNLPKTHPGDQQCQGLITDELPRAASLMEELKEKGGNCLPCGAGDAALVCFQLGGLHPALCTCWSRGTSSLTPQTQQEPPALQELLQVTLSGKQVAAITFSDSSLSLLFTPFASTSTLLLSATLTTPFQISPNQTPRKCSMPHPVEHSPFLSTGSGLRR